ncbi:hypothetical protein IT568_11925 [bacterium]|nr:hypothetical protein [bacterium]
MKNIIFLVFSFFVCFRISFAQKYKVTNPIFTFIPSETNYEAVGNYNNKIFLTGWFDNQAQAKFQNFKDYREIFGQTNTIRADLFNFFTKPNSLVTMLQKNDYQKPMQFIVSMGKYFDTQNPPDTFSVENPKIQEMTKDIVNLYNVLAPINAWKDVYGWYTIDEPHIKSPPTAKKKYVTPEQFFNYNKMLREAEKRAGEIVGTKIRKLIVMVVGANSDAIEKSFLEYGTDPNVDLISNDIYTIHAKPPEANKIPPENRFGKFNQNISQNFYAGLSEKNEFGMREGSFPYFVNSTSKEGISFVYHYEGIKEGAKTIQKLSDLMADTTKNLHRKPLISTIQGFAYKCCGNESGATYKRPPSVAEYRYLVFSLLTSGATGIWCWSARATYHEQGDWIEFGRENSNDFQFGKKADFGTQYFFQTQKKGFNFHKPPSKSELEPLGKEADAFYTQAQEQVFGNSKLVFDELDFYTEKMLRGKFQDDFLQTNFPPEILKVICFNFERSYFVIAVNNNEPDDKTGVIKPLEKVKFFLKNQSVKIEKIDRYPYNVSASFENKIFNNFQKAKKVKTSKDKQGNSFFTDKFNSGEVHIYEIKIMD